MPVGGQPGNKNAAKSRLFEQALIREIKQRDLKDGEGETLRKIAASLLDEAASNLKAKTELRDTLDGRPSVAVEVEGNINVGLASVLSGIGKAGAADNT